MHISKVIIRYTSINTTFFKNNSVYRNYLINVILCIVNIIDILRKKDVLIFKTYMVIQMLLIDSYIIIIEGVK